MDPSVAEVVMWSQECRVTHAAVARALGMTPNNYYYWRKGERKDLSFRDRQSLRKIVQVLSFLHGLAVLPAGGPLKLAQQIGDKRFLEEVQAWNGE